MLIESSFRRYRISVRQKTRDAEAKFINENIRVAEDPKSAWRQINEQLHGKRCLRRLPSYLQGDNADIAELDRTNEFFINVGNSVADQIGYTDPYCELPSYQVKSPLSCFSDPSVTEINEAMRSLHQSSRMEIREWGPRDRMDSQQ